MDEQTTQRMTKRSRPPKVATTTEKLPQVTIYFDDADLLQRFRATAAKSRRSLSAQALHYIERGMAGRGDA